MIYSTVRSWTRHSELRLNREHARDIRYRSKILEASLMPFVR